jgi:hypothetical protein
MNNWFWKLKKDMNNNGLQTGLRLQPHWVGSPWNRGRVVCQSVVTAPPWWGSSNHYVFTVREKGARGLHRAWSWPRRLTGEAGWRGGGEEGTCDRVPAAPVADGGSCSSREGRRRGGTRDLKPRGAEGGAHRGAAMLHPKLAMSGALRRSTMLWWAPAARRGDKEGEAPWESRNGRRGGSSPKRGSWQWWWLQFRWHRRRALGAGADKR